MSLACGFFCGSMDIMDIIEHGSMWQHRQRSASIIKSSKEAGHGTSGTDALSSTIRKCTSSLHSRPAQFGITTKGIRLLATLKCFCQHTHQCGAPLGSIVYTHRLAGIGDRQTWARHFESIVQHRAGKPFDCCPQ